MDVSKTIFSLGAFSKSLNLPRKVQILEGTQAVCSDIHQIHQGDTLELLELKNIAKAVVELTHEITTSSQIFRPESFEILIPLAYGEKLRVINEIKSYELMSQVFADMPRFVSVKEKVIVPQGSSLIEFDKGSVIEIICRQYGQQRGHRKEYDKLRIRYEHGGTPVEVDIPVNTRGMFRSEPDSSLYTLAEVVERYSLPVVAIFQQEEVLYRLFVERFPNITRKEFPSPVTVRLLKVVMQETFVCRVEQTGRPCSRIVILPAANPDVQSMKVRILNEDDPESAIIPIYQNLGDDDDEALEDALQKPELVQIDSDDDYLMPTPKIDQEKHVDEKKEKGPSPKKAKDPGEYVTIKPSSAVEAGSKAAKRSLPQRLTNLALVSKIRGMIHKGDSHETNLAATTKPVVKRMPIDTPEKSSCITPAKETQSRCEELPTNDNEETLPHGYSETSQNVYADINESEMDKETGQSAEKSQFDQEKIFRDLTVEELRERFILCGLEKLAKAAQSKYLDGRYFSEINEEALDGDPFNLSKIEMIKFSKVKEGWKPRL